MGISQKRKIRKKIVVLQAIGIIVRKQGWSPTYTCRYSSGNLILIIQSSQDGSGIKCPLEYLQV